MLNNLRSPNRSNRSISGTHIASLSVLYPIWNQCQTVKRLIKYRGWTYLFRFCNNVAPPIRIKNSLLRFRKKSQISACRFNVAPEFPNWQLSFAFHFRKKKKFLDIESTMARMPSHRSRLALSDFLLKSFLTCPKETPVMQRGKGLLGTWAIVVFPIAALVYRTSGMDCRNGTWVALPHAVSVGLQLNLRQNLAVAEVQKGGL